jgi:hypothetical protein
MDFNSLMAKMRELDQPVTQSMPAAEACGDAPMPTSMPPSMNDQPPPAHPSMSVNLNAQGMDNIESLLKLMTKVNPDMINQPAGIAPPMPSMAPMPSLMPPGPSISSIGDLGNLDAGPLKMLPDLDSEPPGQTEPDADNMGGPSDMDADNDVNPIQKAMGDNDGDGDHDMDDHDMEKDDKQEEPEGEEPEPKEKKTDEWANEPDPEYKDIDYMVNKLSGGLGRQQTMTKHGYGQGDNPLAMRENLRASIKQELAQRLAETKKTSLAELSKNTLKSYQDKAGKDIVNTMTSGDYMTTDKSQKKVMNRMKGSERADNKIYKKDNA